MTSDRISANAYAMDQLLARFDAAVRGTTATPAVGTFNASVRTRSLQTRFRLAAKRATLVGACALLIACDPLAAFEPVIIDDTQLFAIRARDINSSTTGTATYDWPNPHTQATVHHSTTTRGPGSASIRITDATGTLVYSSALLPDRWQSTTKGVPGTWKIEVTMTGYTGTLGFHVMAGAP